MIVEESLIGHIWHMNIKEQCYSLLLLANMHEQAHNECLKAAGFPPKYRKTEVTVGGKISGHNCILKISITEIKSTFILQNPPV